MPFNETVLKLKLQQLKSSSESVQSVASWCLQHAEKHGLIIKEWISVLKEVRDPQKQMNMLFVANEICQLARRAKLLGFVEDFVPAIKEAVSIIKETPKRGELERLVGIWRERLVFDKSTLNELSDDIKAVKLKNEKVVEDTIKSMTLADFRPDQFTTELEAFHQLENSISMTHSFLTKNVPAKYEFGSKLVSKLKDRSGCYRHHAKIEEARNKVFDFIKDLEKHKKLREQHRALLETAENFYDIQLVQVGDLKEIYKTFGKHVQSVKNRLETIAGSSAVVFKPNGETAAESSSHATERENSLSSRIKELQSNNTLDEEDIHIDVRQSFFDSHHANGLPSSIQELLKATMTPQVAPKSESSTTPTMDETTSPPRSSKDLLVTDNCSATEDANSAYKYLAVASHSATSSTDSPGSSNATPIGTAVPSMLSFNPSLPPPSIAVGSGPAPITPTTFHVGPAQASFNPSVPPPPPNFILQPPFMASIPPPSLAYQPGSAPFMPPRGVVTPTNLSVPPPPFSPAVRPPLSGVVSSVTNLICFSAGNSVPPLQTDSVDCRLTEDPAVPCSVVSYAFPEADAFAEHDLEDPDAYDPDAEYDFDFYGNASTSSAAFASSSGRVNLRNLTVLPCGGEGDNAEVDGPPPKKIKNVRLSVPPVSSVAPRSAVKEVPIVDNSSTKSVSLVRSVSLNVTPVNVAVSAVKASTSSTDTKRLLNISLSKPKTQQQSGTEMGVDLVPVSVEHAFVSAPLQNCLAGAEAEEPAPCDPGPVSSAPEQCMPIPTLSSSGGFGRRRSFNTAAEDFYPMSPRFPVADLMRPPRPRGPAGLAIPVVGNQRKPVPNFDYSKDLLYQ